MRPKRIAFYGHFGSGNLGNECTLQVVVDHVRHRWPNARLICLRAAPQDAHSTRASCACGSTIALPPDGPLPESSVPTTHSRAPRTSAAVFRSRLAKLLRLLFKRIPLESMRWIEGLFVLAGCDMLIVPGTQIASDYLCGPTGWPYDLFKWSTLAMICRVEIVYLSIGVGPIYHPLSRWLIGRSLKRARYRSYRDRPSLRYVERLGLSTESDHLYPDLAFGLAVGRATPWTDSRTRARIVGIGLKNYSGCASAADTFAYHDYLTKMAEFVSWLQARRYAVRLLIGDLHYDIGPREDLLRLLRRRRVQAERPRLVADIPLSVRDLVRQLTDTDIVISPRLHNLILALLLQKPVIALSDHAKVDALLTEFGLGRYRIPIETFSLEALITRFCDAERNASRLKRQIAASTGSYGRALRAQYAQVFSACDLAA